MEKTMNMPRAAALAAFLEGMMVLAFLYGLSREVEKVEKPQVTLIQLTQAPEAPRTVPPPPTPKPPPPKPEVHHTVARQEPTPVPTPASAPPPGCADSGCTDPSCASGPTSENGRGHASAAPTSEPCRDFPYLCRQGTLSGARCGGLPHGGAGRPFIRADQSDL